MVSSLPRIGLQPTSAPENKKLSLDLAEIIINWEKQRVETLKASEDKQKDTMSLDNTSNIANPTIQPIVENPTQPSDTIPIAHDEEPDFKPNQAMIEMVVNFLIRMSSAAITPPLPNQPNPAMPNQPNAANRNFFL